MSGGNRNQQQPGGAGSVAPSAAQPASGTSAVGPSAPSVGQASGGAPSGGGSTGGANDDPKKKLPSQGPKGANDDEPLVTVWAAMDFTFRGEQVRKGEKSQCTESVIRELGDYVTRTEPRSSTSATGEYRVIFGQVVAGGRTYSKGDMIKLSPQTAKELGNMVEPVK